MISTMSESESDAFTWASGCPFRRLLAGGPRRIVELRWREGPSLEVEEWSQGKMSSTTGRVEDGRVENARYIQFHRHLLHQ